MLLSGINHIHKQNLIHRHLKPGNILVDMSSSIKICDFGFAAAIPLEGYLHKVVGTKPYQSPETLSKCAYTTKTDIWSIGAICGQLGLRELLFPFARIRIQQLNEIFKVIGTPDWYVFLLVHKMCCHIKSVLKIKIFCIGHFVMIQAFKDLNHWSTNNVSLMENWWISCRT